MPTAQVHHPVPVSSNPNQQLEPDLNQNNSKKSSPPQPQTNGVPRSQIIDQLQTMLGKSNQRPAPTQIMESQNLKRQRVDIKPPNLLQHQGLDVTRKDNQNIESKSVPVTNTTMS